MKKKLLSLTFFLIYLGLFSLLLFTKNEVLFFSSFILILARGIQLFITLSMMQDKAMRQANEESVKVEFNRLLPVFISTLLLQLLPVFLVIADFYIFFYRKEFWVNTLWKTNTVTVLAGSASRRRKDTVLYCERNSNINNDGFFRI